MGDRHYVQGLIDLCGNPNRPICEYAVPFDTEYAVVLNEALLELNFVVPNYVTGAYSEEVAQSIGEFKYGVGQTNDAQLDEQFWDALAWALHDHLQTLPADPEPQAQPAHVQHHDDQQLGAIRMKDFELVATFEQAEDLLKHYQLYKAGMDMGWTDYDRSVFAWLDTSPEFQQAYEEFEQAQDDAQPVMWEDGSVSTRPEHREGVRRRSIQRALDVLTGNSIGAISFGIAKEAGASDDTASSIGEFTGTVGDMVGGHQKATQQGATHPGSTAGPDYAEHSGR